MKKGTLFLVVLLAIVLPFTCPLSKRASAGPKLPNIYAPGGTKHSVKRHEVASILSVCLSKRNGTYEAEKVNALVDVLRDTKANTATTGYGGGSYPNKDTVINCTSFSVQSVLEMFHALGYEGESVLSVTCDASRNLGDKYIDKKLCDGSAKRGDIGFGSLALEFSTMFAMTDVSRYYISFTMFNDLCTLKEDKGVLGEKVKKEDKAEGDNFITVVGDPRKESEPKVHLITLDKPDDEIDMWNNIDSTSEVSRITFSCRKIAETLSDPSNDWVKAYLKYVRDMAPGGSGGGSAISGTAGTCDDRYDPDKKKKENAACVDGFNNKGTAGYCDKTYPAPPSGATSSAAEEKKAQNAACHYGAETATAATGVTPGEEPPSSGGEEPKDKCAIDGIGWLICPVVTFLADVSDTVKDNIDEYLVVNPSELTKRDDGSVYSYWATMRNYANVLFVIAFIIIIYSQISGMGLSSYGIKRMLPRLVAGALLVNVSFYLCAAMVDLSNAIGASAYNFISSGTSAGSGGTSPGSSASGEAWWATTASALLVGGAALFFALGAFIAGLITVLMIALTTLLLLGVRQAIIIFAIIISPLAFVAWLLPNTESLFKKWWQTFKTMLFVYPIIGIIYGASTLASNIIRNQYGGTDGSSVAMQIVAAVLMFVPLMLVPKVLNSAMSIGNIAAITGGLIKGKAGGFLGGAAKAKVGKPGSRFGNYRKMKKERRNAQIRAGVYEGKHPIRMMRSGANRLFNKSRISGGYGDMRAAEGAKEAAHQDHERMEMAEARINNMKVDGAYLNQQQLMEAATTGKVGKTELSAYEQRAAIKKAAAMGTSKDALELAESSANQKDATVRKEIADALAQSGAGERSPYLGGAALADIQAGKFNKNEAIKNAAKGGKITAESLSKADAYSAQQIESSLGELKRSDAYTKGDPNSAEYKEIDTAIKNAMDAADTIKKTKKLRARISGNGELSTAIENIRNGFPEKEDQTSGNGSSGGSGSGGSGSGN